MPKQGTAAVPTVWGCSRQLTCAHSRVIYYTLHTADDLILPAYCSFPLRFSDRVLQDYSRASSLLFSH